MRVARIITSQQHGEDETELTRQLQAAGYEVEVAAPGQAAGAADLQIELEYLPVDQALDTAARLARDGADVFIAPGVVTPQDASAIHETAEAVAPAPPTTEPSAAPEPATEAPGAVEPQPQTEIEDLSAESPALSLVQRVRLVVSERRQRAQERRLERERRVQEEQERRRQEALELHRRREQEARERAERLRVAREQMAREAVLRAERARQIEENERRRASEAPAPVLPRAQQVPAPRLPVRPPQIQPPPAAPRTTLAPPPPAASRTNLAPPMRPVARRVARPPRRTASPRQREWQRAALLASLVALMAMLGFTIAMNLHPVAPLPTQMLQNNAQQKVPFGAATITPAKPAAPAAAPVAATPARKPSTRPSAAREAARPAPPARRSANRAASDDEVVVRHWGSANNARAQQSDGIRRISDQN